MGYYQGDYYAGGRGGIGSFFKGLIGTAAGFIPGVGPIVSKAIGAIPMGRPAAAGLAATGGIVGAGRAIIARGTGAIVKHPVLSAAGAAGAVGLVGGAVGSHLLAGGGGAVGMKGFHMSKPRGGHCPSAPHLVRNRRMNVANGRALGRAVRRLTHFAKKYRKVVGFVSPKRPKGRIYFKKRKSK
jgi:hypothetical protein